MEASYSGANEGLLHDTEINKRKLIDSIRNGDVKIAKQLIREGMNINFVFNDWSPLHAAGELRSMDMLEFLLSQPNIDLNISNERLETPLLNILKYHYDYNWEQSALEEFVLQLIRTGCDINRSNMYYETPLHLSLKYGMEGTTNITHELLKRGADINVCNGFNCTPLHYAVRRNDLELVCMLLNYNADVSIKWRGHTPFSYALHLECHSYALQIECHEIVRVLNNYYSFSDDDVNYIIDNAFVFVVFLKNTNAEIFKAVWPRFDPELILWKLESRESRIDFILLYILWCSYSTSDWLECLYLILNSDIAFDLINHDVSNFLYELQSSMLARCIQSDDRIGLIYMVLQLGFEIDINYINYAVALYGLNQDLEPFIYGTYITFTDDDISFACPLHAFVIGLETDFSVKKISQLFHDALKEWGYDLCYGREYVLAETFVKTVAFFSFPAYAKNSLMSLKDLLDNVIMDEKRLQEIPEFPSLIELSRNQIHKYLVQTFRFKQPYQLQDCVKKLLIPNRIKDIILFKEPIY